MRVHHLNCGTCCPLGGRWLDGRSRGLTSRMVCHCLLVETNEGLVLIDAGLGMQDVRRPIPRLSLTILAMNNLRLRASETAVAQVQGLGFDPADVRHVVLTHLDFDHAGGAADFPNATVHVMEAEHQAARRRAGFWGRRRYRPRQLGDLPSWRLYSPGGEPWHGFSAVRQLGGLAPEILLLSLVGHTRGHAGVAVASDRGWLLHAGDAYVHASEMERDGNWPRVVEYQRVLDVDTEARLGNQARLRALARAPEAGVRVFCAHDPVEFETLRLGSLAFHPTSRSPTA